MGMASVLASAEGGDEARVAAAAFDAPPPYFSLRARARAWAAPIVPEGVSRAGMGSRKDTGFRKPGGIERGRGKAAGPE